MLVKYATNNSGGDWWISDDGWRALADAGWDVEWFADKDDDPHGLHLRDGRFLGALANYASKDFPTPKDAIEEFQRVTGCDASADGCSCCGPPHAFSWKDASGGGYASGSEILAILHPEFGSLTLREAYDRLSATTPKES
jgi:hypothetical protein